MSHQARAEFSLKMKNIAKSNLLTQLWVIPGYFVVEHVTNFKRTSKINIKILMT